jgi:diguanylate cyclase
MIRAVVFDVGECLVDQTREHGTWADWSGVPRHTFAATFGAVIARGLDYREIVLLLADLDGFKAVNDTYGHHTGDQVLRQVAYRLTRAIGTDGLVARLGGDEFAVLAHDCDGTDDRDGRRWAGQVRAALTEPVTTGPHQIQVTASTGTTREPGDLTPDDLLARADAAMYRTKPITAGPLPHPAPRRRTA